jgi:hypothetical protein
LESFVSEYKLIKKQMILDLGLLDFGPMCICGNQVWLWGVDEKFLLIERFETGS